MKIFCCVFGIVIAIFASSSPAQTVAGGPVLTNMSKLLSLGSSFDGKRIIVTGYMCGNTDSVSGLFLTMDDCESGNSDNAVRINSKRASRHCQGITQLVGSFSYKENTFKIDEQYQWGEINVETMLCLPRPGPREEG